LEKKTKNEHSYLDNKHIYYGRSGTSYYEHIENLYTVTGGVQKLL